MVTALMSAEAYDDAETRPAPERVLICEDEGLTSLRLRTVLTKLGYEIVGQARDGQEGVALACQLRPDVILMDVQMPRLDGIGAVRRIMADCPAPVVMLTAFGDENTVRQALAAGASAYLVKPVRDEQLRPAISVARAGFEVALTARKAEARAEGVTRERNRERSLTESTLEEILRVRQRASELAGQLRQEREVARTLAESFLCPTPQIFGLDIATRYEPAHQSQLVGGDYFDFLELPEHRLGIVLGDVCGKGVVAAGCTAMARHMLRAYIVEDPDPAAVVTRLNRALTQYLTPTCNFLTLFYGLLDLDTFHLQYCNGGHPAPLLYSPTRDEFLELGGTGGLVGAMPDWEWHTASAVLEPGGLLAAFTDGLTEARFDGKLLDQEGIVTALTPVRTAPAATVADVLLREACNFAQGQLADDVAIIAIRRAAADRHPEF
jgi:serine phosphatase RsbU (regulator of sigma subunit)